MTVLSLIATILMFIGGVVLTYDALNAPRTRTAEEGARWIASGKEDLNEILAYLHQRQHARTWWGFLVTTIGFLMELIVKGLELCAKP